MDLLSSFLERQQENCCDSISEERADGRVQREKPRKELGKGKTNRGQTTAPKEELQQLAKALPTHTFLCANVAYTQGYVKA